MALKWVVIFVLLDISLQSAHAALKSQVFFASSKFMIIQWDKVTGALSYEIQMTRKDSGATVSFANYGPNTVMGSVIGLTPNVEYTFTVTAKNSSGAVLEIESDDHYTAPDVVDNNITVMPKDSTTVEMVFTPQTGASDYIIRTLNPADPSFFQEDTVSSSPAEITGLQPYTNYTFSIISANSGGRSQPTGPASAKTLLPPPQIQSSSSSDSTIELTWSAVPNAVSYTVCLLKHNANVNQKMTQNTTGTSFTFTGLDPGALYTVESYAWDAENREGEHSAEKNQTTRPPAPGSVTVTMTNNQMALSVSWTMDQNVYPVIQYNVTSDQGQFCTDSVLVCVLAPVSCGEEHTVEVVAWNDAGPSVPSSSVTFTTIPCPPENLDMSETSPGSCNFTWDTVSHASGYEAYIKNADGVEKICNTTGTSCDFTCECGYTYLMSVFAYNWAGLSQEGPVLNFTTVPCCPTSMNVTLVETETLKTEWSPARGAVLYETRANDSSGVILCNDTAPVCALSALSCDTAYSVKVIPCSDLSGCNHNCPVVTRETAACMPTAVSLTKVNSSAVSVSWTSSNRAATYLVTAKEDGGVLSCSSGGTTCDISNLACGTTYEVGVTATSAAGESLPSYTEFYETEPCCPSPPSVSQVTQAMTNVSWSAAKGGHTFRTSLTSTKGHARCHTEDTHCIMGCITCGTSYNVSMEVYSQSGLKTDCSYQGFSSSLCCPSGVRIFRIGPVDLRVSWRSSPGASHTTEVVMRGAANYTCRATPGDTYCDLSGVQCGDEYTVEVAPVKADGSAEDFCSYRKYAVSCAGVNVGSILFRGKRSVK